MRSVGSREFFVDIEQRDSYTEGNLAKKSVVVISQVFTIDKAQLVEFIGALSRQRVKQILAGLRLLTEPRDIE